MVYLRDHEADQGVSLLHPSRLTMRTTKRSNGDATNSTTKPFAFYHPYDAIIRPNAKGLTRRLLEVLRA